MDLLIKNMEMPKSCYTCQFCDNYEGSFCLATNDEHQIDHMTAIRRRPKWCPLVEVKPHGRSIDADELIAKIKRPLTNHSWVWASQVQPIIDLIESAPTVLEATKTDNKKKYSSGYPYPSETATSYSKTMEARNDL